MSTLTQDEQLRVLQHTVNELAHIQATVDSLLNDLGDCLIGTPTNTGQSGSAGNND